MMKILRAILISVLLLLIAAGGFSFWLYRELRRPIAHQQAEQFIEIPRGSSPAETLERLASVGIISRAWPLHLYLRASGAGAQLKAGEYRFPSPISPLGVARKLEEGQQRLNRFTVIEGWTRWDVAAALVRVPEFQLASADEALELMNDTASVKDIDPEAQNLEGYLYPDTYTFPPQTTAPEVIKMMVRRFRQVWREKIAEHAPDAPGQTPRQVVTIASLIETEAKLPEERPLISSVIHNRLRLGIPLGIDSTIIYAAKLAGKWKNDGKVYQSDLDRSSPYNTRKVNGLPPGPLASPGEKSLEAALNPAATDYLYYVREPSRNDGAHNFYSNETDFEKGVQSLRQWERTRDDTSAGNADVGNANVGTVVLP